MANMMPTGATSPQASVMNDAAWMEWYAEYDQKYLALAGRAAMYADTAFFSCKYYWLLLIYRVGCWTTAQLTSTICCDAQQAQF